MMKLRSGPDRLSTLALAFPLLILAATYSLAQAPARTATKFYPDFSDTADALLRNAASHARDKQWGEAIEIYQRVISHYGDKVAKLPKEDEANDRSGESVLYVDLRQFCQRRLAALPPEAWAIYRSRVDGQAERWFRQGHERRDRAALRRVIAEAFCSSWGDDALDLLGDLGFQDGRFVEALSAYRQLVPDRPDDHPGLIYPDPSVDLARVAAKKILCRVALGEPGPTPAELEAFQAAYPGASGSLAGRTGPYVDTLRAALAGDRLAPTAQPDGRWPTFAGSPTRTRVVPGPVDVGSLQWRVGLDAFNTNRRYAGMGGFRASAMGGSSKVPDDRLLCYHPIVLGDLVIVSGENKIQAYNLNDRPEGTAGNSAGSVNPVWEAPPDGRDSSAAMATPGSATIPRYTLTAFGNRIYARLGPTNTMSPMLSARMGASASQSRIIAVDRSTEGKILWSKPAAEITIPKRPADGSARLGFEGTPLADAHHVYVAMTERREQIATYVVCLDAENGSVRWLRYLGAASADGDVMPFAGMGMGMPMTSSLNDFGHRLLTLDGPTIYYQTNLGAVVALDAETGGIRWVATYPRQDRAEIGPRNERDLNPAIVHEGLVIVAPEDASSIYAFDAGTGRLAWRTDPLPVEVKLAHLLGVAKGRLVATGDRVLLFDIKDGRLLSTWPDSGHVYEGFGRGLLAGERIYWPTRNEIHILDQATGQRADQPIKLQQSFQTTGGNLAVGDGYLIVAQADALVVFCQNSRLIQRYREEIARNPEQASSYFRLAQAAEATGQDDLALKSLAQALEKVRASETIDGTSLFDATRDHQYRLLMRLGNKARGARGWSDAAARYESAAGAARADRDRLLARLYLSEVQTERGAPGEAVEILQALLADERIRLLNVAADDGHRTIRADLLIGDRLGSILRRHGRAVYAHYDEEARQLLQKGKLEKSPRLLEEVGRSYPAAEVLPESLLELGRLCDSLERPGDAAHAYKRLLAAATSDMMRARALWGLANAYDQQRLWVPARDTYVEALTRFGNVAVSDAGPESRLGDLIAQRLARDPYSRMTADRLEPSLPVPLARRWGRSLSGSLRPLGAQGVPPSASASRIFLAEGSALVSIDPATGASAWSTDIGGAPVWVGYLADKIVAASDSRIVALGLEKGTVEWVYSPEGAQQGRTGANPFAKPEAEPEPAGANANRLRGFQIVGSRLFCRRGNRGLLAIDGDSGLVDWSFEPAAGTIHPLLLIGPQQIVLQVLQPNSILVLDTQSGRRKSAFPHNQDDGWLRTPLPIDDRHVALVPDRKTIALFDLRRGVFSWTFQESDQQPKNGPPRLLGNAERLLVVHDGTELIRLDPATGTKLWSWPLGAEDLSERPEATTLDGERFYWACDRSLGAVNLADGKPAWTRQLTGADSGWALELTDRCVLAFPVFLSATPGEGEALPLVFRRRDSGDLEQRVLFPVAVSDVTVRLTPHGAVVATREGVWSLGERPGIALKSSR